MMCSDADDSVTDQHTEIFGERQETQAKVTNLGGAEL